MGLDSVELVMEFEDEFEITIPDADAEQMETIGDVILFVIYATKTDISDEAAVQRIRDKLYDIVAEQMTVDRRILSDQTHFVRDLNVN